MAGCYDTQDFKSDLNIEVAREGDILEAGQDLNEIECNKNPGHRDFIPFKDLTLEHLPIAVRKTERLEGIKIMSSRVVRLVVDKIRNGKWIKEAGSGCVVKFYNEYYIQTNNHVVKTEEEVKHCTVEFHYDDDSRSSVKTSRGVKLLGTGHYRDLTLFNFHPVPDFLYQLDLMYCLMPSILIMYINNHIATEISIVRYISYQINVFSPLNLNSSIIHLMFIFWPDYSISYLKSSYFKFQPIPSNKRQLTSIQIHIVGNDGNGRVIPGDVVNFGDEFVVKISESIFQDEVKKCRLVLNGEVIGRGTRLYFPQVKTSDIYSGIDLAQYMEQGKENFWMCDCYPKPRELKVALRPIGSNNLCCIGHPHAGPKMVTFGRLLGKSLRRFDNQNRHIAQTEKDCQCKEVSCVNYSCKTCPGSSGSPINLLHKELEFGSGFSHFMGERIKPYRIKGELIENKNIAWIPSKI